MKIITFTDSDNERVEKQVNDWLAEHPRISVTNITPTESLSDSTWSFTITIVYIGED